MADLVGLREQTTDGTLPAYVWPGGYQMVYTRDGLTICPDCANKRADEVNDDQAVEDGEIYYEGPDLECDDCGTAIESSYGDPDAGEPEPGDDDGGN